MKTSLFPRLPGFLELVALALGLSHVLMLLVEHWSFICYPACQEVNENSVWYHTWLLFNGRNSFAVSELPAAAYCFSPLYNYVVLLLSPVLGISYSAHRFINLLCILGVFWLTAREMRRLGAGWGFVGLAIAVLYWEIFRNLMMTARPDAMGWLIYMFALVIPWRRGFSVGSSAVGLLLCLLAFYFKSYFLVGSSLILLGVWAHHGRRPALSLTVCFGLALLLSTWVANILWPSFWLQSFGLQLECVRLNSHGWIALLRFEELVVWTWPCLLILIVGSSVWLWRLRPAGLQELLGRLWKGARIRRSEALLVPGLYLAFLMLLVNIYIGRNGGACFTYQLHLLLPLIFILCSPLLRGFWVPLLVFGGLAVALSNDDWHAGYPTDEGPYRRAQEVLASSRNPYVDPVLVDIALAQNKAVQTTGNSLLVPMAFCREWQNWFSQTEAVRAVWELHRAEVLEAVRLKKYDIMILQDGMPNAFMDHEQFEPYYRFRERLDFPMAWGVDVKLGVWIPRHD